MRITGGRARSIPLRTGKNAPARPATDRMREAVFSSLGAKVNGIQFLDLFAGSGAYGLEAWSRGAAGGVLVEKHRMMVEAIRANIAAVGRSIGAAPSAVSVVAADVLRWRPAGGAPADIIFVDPPYEIIADVAPALFERFAEWLGPDGTIVFEMPGDLDLRPAGWECVKRIGRGGRQPACAFFVRAPRP
jgi:16S rRNA (guanine966-N2)-methyltransferase